MASKVGWEGFSFYTGDGQEKGVLEEMHWVIKPAYYVHTGKLTNAEIQTWWWKCHQYTFNFKFFSQKHWKKWMAFLYKWNEDSILICSSMFKMIVNISMLLCVGDLPTETSSQVSFGRHRCNIWSPANSFSLTHAPCLWETDHENLTGYRDWRDSRKDLTWLVHKSNCYTNLINKSAH